MEIRGTVVSVFHGTAEVCVIKEMAECGDCSACPTKAGVRDVMKVAVTGGLQVGQKVVLRDTKNWFVRNKITLTLIAFVAGVIMSELMSLVTPFGVYRNDADIFGGCLLTTFVLAVLWMKRPRYPFRITRIEGGDTHT
ncbi:MAG TPA: SoxR reducing system RseC family protein [Candidatus Brocadiaceae bacterium]|nr:SoxR reducing system RseC family protein [Candidatus Brocadiaceae bacterium]